MQELHQDPELGDILYSVALKSLNIIEAIRNEPQALQRLLKQWIDLIHDYQTLLGIMLRNPEQIWKMQLAYWQDALSLAEDQFNHWLEGKPLPISDPRFSAEEWVHNPFFNLLSQHYLLASEHLNSLFEHLDYGDNQLAKRLRFFSRQYLDALSPANFITTNPQLLAETIQTHGKNLLLGLRNFLTDMEEGSSRLLIKMTDTDAFKLGGNIATTKGKVIYRNEMMELIQYSAQTKEVFKKPLLIVPPWINKYYILDLSPHNSFIGWLVKQGMTVFVISWVNPDEQYANKGLFDYLNEGPLTAIQIIKKQLQIEKINILGFCIGGTLVTCLLAYLKALGIKSIQSATFLASLIDFSNPGDISVFIDEQQIRRIEEEMHAKGFLDGHFMASTFNSLRANDLIWSFFIKNYLQGKNPVPFDILFWNADATNMPAKMHSQYLRWMYLHNRLIKPNKIKLNHVPLDVSKIDLPTFFVSTLKDHIAPWQATYLGFQALGGKKQFLLGGSGHIAGIVNPVTSKKYGFHTHNQCESSPELWLSKARSHEGSWWPEWLNWLKSQSGGLIPAVNISKLPLKGIMNAPGSYVLKHHRAEKNNLTSEAKKIPDSQESIK